jgi:glutathione S-transferase
MLDDWFASPPAMPTASTRGPDAQAAVDAATAGMTLYHYESCTFCARVRRAIAALHLAIEMRDVLAEPAFRRELVAGGGRATVPCLRIPAARGETERWLYESEDIVAYLGERFGRA